MFFEFQWEVNNGLLRILLKGQIFAFDVYFTTQTSILRSRDTLVHSTVQSDRLSHSWCKDYAKLRNILFRSISSRFAPFRSANYSKPRVITIGAYGGDCRWFVKWAAGYLQTSFYFYLITLWFSFIHRFSVTFPLDGWLINLQPSDFFHELSCGLINDLFIVQRQPVQYFSL